MGGKIKNKRVASPESIPFLLKALPDFSGKGSSKSLAKVLESVVLFEGAIASRLKSNSIPVIDTTPSYTVKILGIGTDICILNKQCRLRYFQEQSDQGLHCSPFHLHILIHYCHFMTVER